MKTIYKFKCLVAIALTAILCFSSCSSKDEPIAEIFVGKWNIDEKKTPDTTNNTPIEGSFVVFFDANTIAYKLEIADPDNPLNITGIIWDNVLYNDISKEITYATLELNSSDKILKIEYDYLDKKATYYAKRVVETKTSNFNE